MSLIFNFIFQLTSHESRSPLHTPRARDGCKRADRGFLAFNITAVDTHAPHENLTQWFMKAQRHDPPLDTKGSEQAVNLVEKIGPTLQTAILAKRIVR